jgi:hypothetical protein
LRHLREVPVTDRAAVYTFSGRTTLDFTADKGKLGDSVTKLRVQMDRGHGEIDGGGLVATHETSLCDERGRQRQDFGLASLFGASFAGNVIQRQQNAYLNIEDHTHPLLAGLEDAGRMIHAVMRVEIKTPAGLRAPLMTVPSYPDLPMEEVYMRYKSTDIPGVMVRSVGAGRLVYFPWDIDRTFWEVMSQDHGMVLANAVRWVANEEQTLSVQGPGVIDVSLWQQESSMTAHLVNISNPMMMRTVS